MTERGIARAERDGRIARAAHGVYALPGADPAILAAVRAGGLLTCDAAAQALGLATGVRSARPHVVTRNRSADRLRIVRHGWRAEHADGPLPVVRAPDCAAHALRCLPAMAALIIVDSALASGQVSLAEVAQRLQNRHSAAPRGLLDLTDAACQSPLETVARVLLRVRGLHVASQVRLGGVGRVDLLVEGVLVVELDGFAYHADRGHYREDRRRANAVACLGFGLLRFTFEDVMYRPSEVVACVEQTLARWRSSVSARSWDSLSTPRVLTRHPIAADPTPPARRPA